MPQWLSCTALKLNLPPRSIHFRFPTPFLAPHLILAPLLQKRLLCFRSGSSAPGKQQSVGRPTPKPIKYLKAVRGRISLSTITSCTVLIVGCRGTCGLKVIRGIDFLRSDDNGFVTEPSSISNLALEITIECSRRKLLDSAQFREIEYIDCSHADLDQNLRNTSSMPVLQNRIPLICFHSSACHSGRLQVLIVRWRSRLATECGTRSGENNGLDIMTLLIASIALSF